MTHLPAACARYDADLSALSDGELSSARADEVRAHADVCSRCGAQLAAFASLDRALRASAPSQVPEDLRARVAAAIDGATTNANVVDLHPPSFVRKRAPVWGTALAAAASFALYLAFSTSTPPVERPDVAPASETIARALDAVSDEELAVLIEYDTIRDLEMIANLELLEELAALDGGLAGPS
jgi:anti-sigma factor RsiW